MGDIFEKNGNKVLRCLNSTYPEIQLDRDFKFRGCVVQQKQRKHKSLHYYLPNKLTGAIEFRVTGKEKNN